MANLELGVPLAPDDVFRIASVTKTFTAAMIVKLAETGGLKLDDPLALYLPDFPTPPTLPFARCSTTPPASPML